jgi:hypothetical protein
METITIDGKEYTLDEVRTLVKAGALNVGAKNDTSSSTPNATSLYGPFPGDNTQFGPFSGAGVRPEMYSALAQVQSIASAIPFLPTDIYQELLEIMTGVSEGSGSNETSACATGPTAGDMKTMQQAYTFGIVHLSSKIHDITQVGMRRNRASVDREIYNLAVGNNPFIPNVPGVNGDGVVSRKLRASMFTLGTELNRNVSPVHYVGTAGTEDNSYRGVARQWNGLDNLIKTGYTDNVTGLAAPAADSDVRSFNAVITASDSNGSDFVNALTDLCYGANEVAMDTNMGNVQHALVMRPDLFREAARQFAYALPVYVGAGTTAAPLNREGMQANQMFEQMLNGRYLLIDGQQMPVILDDSIPRETVANNQYKSDIYLVALAAGTGPLLYGEYFDMDNESANEFATAFGIDADSSTTVNNGLYRVFKRTTGGCIEFDFFARVRLILDAPFLSGRLDDVIYNSYYRQTDARPGMSYYRDGGVTYRS